MRPLEAVAVEAENQENQKLFPHPLRCAVGVGGPAVPGHSRQKRVCRGGWWGMATRREGGGGGVPRAHSWWSAVGTEMWKQPPSQNGGQSFKHAMGEVFFIMYLVSFHYRFKWWERLESTDNEHRVFGVQIHKPGSFAQITPSTLPTTENGHKRFPPRQLDVFPRKENIY